MAKLKVLTLDNLGVIKNYIDGADAKSLKTVAIDGNTLKFYRVEEPVGETAPAYEITLPETDLSEILASIEALESGKADKATTLAGYGITDAYTKTEMDSTIGALTNEESGILAQAKAYADGKDVAISAAKDAADAAQADVDALEAKIGTVEDGKTVVGMIEEVVASAYDDTEVRELIQANTDAVNAHKEAIDGIVTTLVGEDANKSVRTIANEELAKQLIAEGAQESLDTLQEIASWIQEHPGDAAAMSKAIDDLAALVGTLPEGVTATTIAGYINEAVASEKARAEGIESGLNSRLETVETAIGENGSVTNAIADAKKAGTDAASAVTALESGKVAENAAAIVELQGIVGEGCEAITVEEINALFS